MTDGHVEGQTGRATDVQTIGWGGGARWGCKATYSLLMVGGPLDW